MKKDRCTVCGYSEKDARFHMDHHLCSNAGNAPWESKEAAQEEADTYNPYELCPVCGKQRMEHKTGYFCEPKPSPQVEPSESAGEENRCPHGVWKADHCYQCVSQPSTLPQSSLQAQGELLKRIAELESQQAADREDLRVTNRALELMCNDFNILELASSQKFPSTVSEYLTTARQESNPAAAEGGR